MSVSVPVLNSFLSVPRSEIARLYYGKSVVDFFIFIFYLLLFGLGAPPPVLRSEPGALHLSGSWFSPSTLWSSN